MTELSYHAAPVAVRGDLGAAHLRAWQRIARPGTWLSGPVRVAIAAETRNAPGCALCRERRAALSPYAVSGSHHAAAGLADAAALPDAMVEAIHRIVTDSGRLKHAWYAGLLESGLAAEEYVELVSVVCTTISIDTFCRAIGVDPHPLPEPAPGAPSRVRPSEASQGAAWVPWIAPEDAAGFEDELFAPAASNVVRALSLVPDECRGFFDVVQAQYLELHHMRDFDTRFRAIDRQQIELIAGRVSAINQCVY